MYHKKSKLDHALWFVENYLPPEEIPVTRKKLHLDTLAAKTINQIQELVSVHSKLSTQKNEYESLIHLRDLGFTIPKIFEANRTSQVET